MQLAHGSPYTFDEKRLAKDSYIPHVWVDSEQRRFVPDYFDVGIIHGNRLGTSAKAKWWVRYGEAAWWDWVHKEEDGDVANNNTKFHQEDWSHSL